MIRLRIANGIAAALMLCGALSHSFAADKKAKPTPTPGELATLRQTVEDQSTQIKALTDQIQALTQQVAHLTELLQDAKAAPVPAPQHPAATENPSAAVTSGSTQPAPENTGSHVVAKGETLTSIAKHYKITVGDLEKVNKIENDRTLQIGQTLVIPTPAPSPTPQ